jgi:hypothetical protein
MPVQDPDRPMPKKKSSSKKVPAQTKPIKPSQYSK